MAPQAPQGPPPPAGPAPVVPGLEGATGEELVHGLDADLDDAGDEDDEAGGLARPAAQSPLLQLPDEELEKRWRADPASLGSMSVGRPSAGLLVNGVQMPDGPNWRRIDPSHEWGTREMVDALAHIIDKVAQRYPGSMPLPIGHISAKNGGPISPHRSHQAGRDVDLGYYHRSGNGRDFFHGNEQTLDLARNWLVLKTAVKETPVEMIFLDSSIQRLLADYALQNGEDPSFVDEIFQVRGKNARAPIRHWKGHANHFHIRFHSPVAEALGGRLARVLPHPQEPKRSPNALAHGHGGRGGHEPAHDAPEPTYATVKAHSGDTLIVWAKRYGTTVEDLQRVNGLKGSALKIGQTYKVPGKAPPPAPAKAVVAHKAGKGAAPEKAAPAKVADKAPAKAPAKAPEKVADKDADKKPGDKKPADKHPRGAVAKRSAPGQDSPKDDAPVEKKLVGAGRGSSATSP